MEGIVWIVSATAIGGATLLLAVVLDIRRRGCSSHLTWPAALGIYALKVIRSLKIHRAHRSFLKDTVHFSECQADLLLDTIRAHETSAYGRDHGLSSVRTVDEFRRRQPVTDFSHYKEYVDRVAAGDTSAMFGVDEQVEMVTETSGTTGPNKRFPVTHRACEAMVRLCLFGSNQLAHWCDVAPWNLRQCLFVHTVASPRFTSAGFRQGTVSGLLAKTFDVTSCFCVPLAAYGITEERRSHYVFALFALRDKQLNSVRAGFLSTLISFMKRMEVHQADLVRDIGAGKIKHDLDIPDGIRAVLEAHLEPMPARAEEVRRAFAGGSDGLLARLWPDLSFIMGAYAGLSNEAYYHAARRYCGPAVHVCCVSFAGSETGVIAIVMDQRRPVVLTLVPDVAFYEFLPVHDDQIQELAEIRREEVLLPSQLQVGAEVEILVTTRSGLYRYRLGDVFRVVDFYNNAPQLEFLYRAGQLLNINFEKVSEKVFFLALEDACRGWPPEVVLLDYTVASSELLTTRPPADSLQDIHSLLFLELDGPALSDQQKQMVDEALQQRHEMYGKHRQEGRFGPLAVHQVPAGTFQRYREHVAATSTVNLSQFKMPRVLRTSEKVQWFVDACR